MVLVLCPDRVPQGRSRVRVVPGYYRAGIPYFPLAIVYLSASRTWTSISVPQLQLSGRPQGIAKRFRLHVAENDTGVTNICRNAFEDLGNSRTIR